MNQVCGNVPCVSLLVTVYNRAGFLGQTLKSILASDFSDFEVVVVDDCSTDGSADVVQQIAESDSRIRFYRNEKNLGDYGNRMQAASFATGRYIKYVDSDDLIYPHTLKLMVHAMERNESLALAVSHSLPEEEEPYPWILTPSESYRKHFLGRGCFACGPTGAIIRRSAFEEVGGFRPEWRVLSDIELWLRLGAKWPVALLPPGLVWWRRHSGQEFSGKDARLVYLKRGYELAIDALTDSRCPLSADDRALSLAKVRQDYARRLLALATKGRSPMEAWKLFRASGLTSRELASGLQRYQ